MMVEEMFFMWMDRKLRLEELLNDVLNQLKKKLVEKGKDQIPIKDLSTDSKTIFKKRSKEIKCKGGWLNGLETVRSGEEISVGLEGDQLPLSTKLFLDKLCFGFQECILSPEEGPRIKETINATVEGFSLAIELVLIVKGMFYELRLKSMEVDECGKVDLSYCSEQRSSPVPAQLGKFLTFKFETCIVEILIKTLKKEIQKTLEQYDTARTIHQLLIRNLKGKGKEVVENIINK